MVGAGRLRVRGAGYYVARDRVAGGVAFFFDDAPHQANLRLKTEASY